MKTTSAQRGMTLTELLISVAIIGLLTSIIGVFMTEGIKFSRLSTAKGEVQRDARRCIDLINRNLRQGVSNTVTLTRFDANQPPYSMIQYTGIDGSNYEFYQYQNQFWMGVQPGGAGAWQTRKVADNLRNLFFAYPQIDVPTIVSVSLCFEKSTYQGSSKTLQLSVDKVRIMN